MKAASPLPCYLFVLSLLSSFSFAQSPPLPNEVVLHSFVTVNGKRLILAKDTADAYIVYRFGTLDKTEFEFPEKNNDSWKKFSYSYYFRGGGSNNEGLDLNYLYFTHEGFQYIIYDTYSASDNQPLIGIKIINLKTNAVVNINGIISTQEGLLMEFRNNDLVTEGDRMFD